MMTLVALLMIPLLVLNLLGGIVSGIWLAILGEWWAIGYGIAGLFSHFILSLILMPGLTVAIPAALLIEKGRTSLAFPFILLSQVYTYAVVTTWCMFVFYLFMSRSSQSSFWPLLVWSYGVALGPWMYMAQKEEQGDGGENSSSALTIFFTQVAYMVMSLAAVFGEASLVTLGIFFGAVMLIGMLIQSAIAFSMLRAEKRQLKDYSLSG